MIAAAGQTIAEMREVYNTGAFAQAAEMGWELLKTDPRDPELLNLLALSEHKQGRHPAAIVLLKRATKANPDGVCHWNDLGNVYSCLREFALAREAYQRALECAPGCAEAYNNLGVLAGDLEDFEEARRLYEVALSLRPHYVEATYNLGIALAHMGKFQKAARRYEHAISLQPDHSRALFNLSLTRLLLGDLAGGWKVWESRWQTPQLAPALRQYRQPAWKGEALEGKRILLYAEQGIGDTLQFIRYVPLVSARGAAIILEVQKPLHSLFAPMLGNWSSRHGVAPQRDLIMLAPGDPIPDFDLHCSLMSLPAVFQTALGSIPSPQGYLRPQPASPGPNARPNKAPDALRVGIVWAGSPTHKRDDERSLPLQVLRPLLDISGIRWFSLQKGVAVEQLAHCVAKDAAFAQIEDAAAAFVDYQDTAAAIDDLDLVITVDTSVAHLTGAMGRPVWILLQHHLPDWRWLLGRTDSPWYHSARLFRQQTVGDWAGVVEDVRQELIKLIASAKDSHKQAESVATRHAAQ